MIELRDYQQEAVQAVDAALDRGVRKQLMVLPTGGGKTIVFSAISQARQARPILILAHRDELLSQAREKLVSVAPELAMSCGLVKAKSNDVNAPVVIASIQTLARRSRLDQLPTTFGTVIIDEAHHAAADSYQRVIDHVTDADLILGVTATPERHDGKSLESIFDELVFAKSIEEMIREGYLVPPVGKRISVDVDLSQVKVTAGDFQGEALASALEEAGTPAEVLATYMEHGENRKTLVFAPTVAMAHHLADVFRGAGLSAEALDGETPKLERDGILNRLKTGETNIVCNVGVLTEGFDEPSVSCVILAAPTKSRAKYTQIIGRGLRLHPAKTDCLILDVAGASDDLSIESLPTLFGLRELLDGENVIEALERQAEEDAARRIQELEEADRQAAEEEAEKERKRKRRADSIKFFGRDRMHWTVVNGRWTIPFGNGQTLVIWPENTDDRFAVLLVDSDRSSCRILARSLDFGYAQGVVEESIRKHGRQILADTKAHWRSEPITQGQRRYLYRLGQPMVETKGEAADLITQAKLAEELGRVEVALDQHLDNPRPEREPVPA